MNLSVFRSHLNGALKPRNKSSGLVDPYFNKVSLLMKMDSAATNANFIDVSGNHPIITPNGLASISEERAKFGARSAKFVQGAYGVNNNLTFPSSKSLFLDINDFTIEFWVYLNATGIGYQPFISSYAAGDATSWIILTEASNPLYFYASSGAGWNIGISTSAIPEAQKWHHVAVTRRGVVFQLFFNGISVGSTTSAASIYNTNCTIAVGGYKFLPSGQRTFGGYLDEVRITNGVCRYYSNFAVPTMGFPNK